jgi:hypothetical protein
VLTLGGIAQSIKCLATNQTARVLVSAGADIFILSSTYHKNCDIDHSYLSSIQFKNV